MNDARAASNCEISVRVSTSGIKPITRMTAAADRLTSKAMMAITISNSTSVNAERRVLPEDMRVISASPWSLVPIGGWTPPSPRFFTKPFQQLDQRQKQRDHDRTDDEAQHHDHERLQQADKALDHDVDFLIVHIGDLV